MQSIKEQAIAEFRELVGRYGTRWTAAVPQEAWERLNKINEVLTEQDRREALTRPLH